MFVTRNSFQFSVDQIGNQRLKFQHKICFKNDRLSLKLKTSPTLAIVGRLFRDGKFIRMYKNCQKFYIKYVMPSIHRLPPNNQFKNFFLFHQSFKDFNRVLFWKIMSINPLFNLKKIKNRKLLYYLLPNKRMVLILKWLKFIVKLNKKNFKNNNEFIYKPIYTFIATNNETNEIYKLKLKIYKLRLVRG